MRRCYGDRRLVSWILNLQRFLLRACHRAAVDMRMFKMNWEGCSMVCGVFHGAEVGVFWPPELILSIGIKPLGCLGICLVAQL